MSVTDTFVSWHTGYDSEAFIHTIKKKYFNSSEEALEFYENLGETYAKKIVSPSGVESFSSEWAQYIPEGKFNNVNVVSWHVEFSDSIHTILIRYFDNEEEVVPFYEALGETYAKKYFTPSNSESFSEEWAQFL